MCTYIYVNVHIYIYICICMLCCVIYFTTHLKALPHKRRFHILIGSQHTSPFELPILVANLVQDWCHIDTILSLFSN